MAELLPQGEVIVQLWCRCPQAEVVTDYDRRHVYLFGNLLQAERGGATMPEMARMFFSIGFGCYPGRAPEIVRTHLARAHWLKANGFPFLDW
jgi:hypothetical protein